MDLVWYIRYKLGGGDQPVLDWEFSKGLTWETAPAPAQVGRKLAHAVLHRDLPDESAPMVNNVVHWVTGAQWGAVSALVANRRGRPLNARNGPLCGLAVCATSYVVLPVLKLYKPIWQYDAKTLYKDFSAHTVYGLTTAVVFSALAETGARFRSSSAQGRRRRR